MGDNISKPVSESLGTGENVLEEDQGGEDDLDDDGDVGFEELENEFDIAVNDGEDDNYSE